ncbi:MAG: hypothetical protein ACRCZP_12355 [Phycicoccus sp.]
MQWRTPLSPPRIDGIGSGEGGIPSDAFSEEVDLGVISDKHFAYVGLQGSSTSYLVELWGRFGPARYLLTRATVTPALVPGTTGAEFTLSSTGKPARWLSVRVKANSGVINLDATYITSEF